MLVYLRIRHLVYAGVETARRSVDLKLVEWNVADIEADVRNTQFIR